MVLLDLFGGILPLDLFPDIQTKKRFMSNDTLTTAQVSQLFHVTERTLRRWVREGKLSEIRLSSRIRLYRREDIAGLLEPRSVTPKAKSEPLKLADPEPEPTKEPISVDRLFASGGAA